MVKVLLFSERETISLLYKYAALRFKKSVVFAQTLFSKNSGLANLYNVTTAPSVVIQKESSITPIIHKGTLSKESLLNLLENNKYLMIPQLQYWNFHELCSGKTCVILVSQNDESLQQILENLGNLKQSIQFGWVNSYEQPQFASYFSTSIPYLVLVQPRSYVLYEGSIMDSKSLGIWFTKINKGEIKV
jgi:hypothetical protein